MNRRRLVALRLLGLGWYVAACIVIGVVGGLGLDRLSGLTPLFTLLGVLLGTVAAFYGLYKMVRPLLNSPASTEKPHANGDLP
jgi:F0F1-type ATP synthase assembly protein I